MEYTYLIEEKIKTSKNISLKDIFIEENINYITILCYHINNKSTFPFIQFLTQYLSLPFLNSKKEICYNESLFLPICYFEDCNKNIESEILKKIKNIFNLLNETNVNITADMYKGLYFSEDGKSIYALVNLSNIKICGLQNEKIENYPWFVLPSEILNTMSCYNININKDIVKLFELNPELSLLINPRNNRYFNIPDVAFTIDNVNDVKFKSVFGNQRSNLNECNYYFYYRSFDNILKLTQKTDNNLGINRYAVFIEGKLHFEKKKFILTEKEIDLNYPENCIIICYDNENYNPDLLVKNNDYSESLSFLLVDL